MEVIWQEPAQEKRKRGHYLALEQELRANPNRWALVSNTKQPTTALPRFCKPEFQRAYRTGTENGEKRFYTYVRFVGTTE
jgi:hypothetical protein